MDSYDILVIMLSIALGISLIIWIMVGVLFVQVLKKVRTAADTAQSAAENIESFTEGLKNAGRATAVGSVIKQVTNAFKGKKDKKGK